MTSSVILIAERDEVLRHNLTKNLFSLGCQILGIPDEVAIQEILSTKAVNLIIVGPSLAGIDTKLGIVQHIRMQAPSTPIILINFRSSEERVIAALRMGINDYFQMPIPWKEMVESARKLIMQSLQRSTTSVRQVKVGGECVKPFIGQCACIRKVMAYVLNVAPTNSTALITGDTGTGKERIAELIHLNSPRQAAPIVDINCAAVPDSLFESELFGYERGAFTGAYTSYPGKLKLADGGTLFLDEIGDMGLPAQAKLLRVIEGKQLYRLGGEKSVPVDVRIIAATNQDLLHLVQKGLFRKDLYFRLNVIRIELPRLRDRKEDIPLLLEHFVREQNLRFGLKVKGFSEEAVELLLQYDWPGNVRELKNMVEAAFLSLPSTDLSYLELPESVHEQLREVNRIDREDKTELDKILAALYATNWNKSKAAQKLNWSRMTLYRKILKYKVSANAKERDPKDRDPK